MRLNKKLKPWQLWAAHVQDCYKPISDFFVLHVLCEDHQDSDNALQNAAVIARSRKADLSVCTNADDATLKCQQQL